MLRKATIRASDTHKSAKGILNTMLRIVVFAMLANITLMPVAGLCIASGALS
jgi:hypothetical protein